MNEYLIIGLCIFFVITITTTLIIFFIRKTTTTPTQDNNIQKFKQMEILYSTGTCKDPVKFSNCFVDKMIAKFGYAKVQDFYNFKITSEMQDYADQLGNECNCVNSSPQPGPVGPPVGPVGPPVGPVNPPVGPVGPPVGPVNPPVGPVRPVGPPVGPVGPVNPPVGPKRIPQNVTAISESPLNNKNSQLYSIFHADNFQPFTCSFINSNPSFAPKSTNGNINKCILDSVVVNNMRLNNNGIFVIFFNTYMVNAYMVNPRDTDVNLIFAEEVTTNPKDGDGLQTIAMSNPDELNIIYKNIGTGSLDKPRDIMVKYNNTDGFSYTDLGANDNTYQEPKNIFGFSITTDNYTHHYLILGEEPQS
jgi:hypothetical protein